VMLYIWAMGLIALELVLSTPDTICFR